MWERLRKVETMIENNSAAIIKRIETLKANADKKVSAAEVANYLEPIADQLKIYEDYCDQVLVSNVESNPNLIMERISMKLRSGEMSNKKYPDTFLIPSLNDRMNLKDGNIVKVNNGLSKSQQEELSGLSPMQWYERIALGDRLELSMQIIFGILERQLIIRDQSMIQHCVETLQLLDLARLKPNLWYKSEFESFDEEMKFVEKLLHRITHENCSNKKCKDVHPEIHYNHYSELNWTPAFEEMFLSKKNSTKFVVTQ